MLVAAIIAANLFGILGVVVAAPILATAALVEYVMRKMSTFRTVSPEKEVTQPAPTPGSRILVAIRRLFRDRRPKYKK